MLCRDVLVASANERDAHATHDRNGTKSTTNLHTSASHMAEQVALREISKINSKTNKRNKREYPRTNPTYRYIGHALVLFQRWSRRPSVGGREGRVYVCTCVYALCVWGNFWGHCGGCLEVIPGLFWVCLDAFIKRLRRNRK